MSATPSPSLAQSGQQQVTIVPSALQYPAPVFTIPPTPQPLTIPTTATADITAGPDSPPDPATITYYAPSGASFMFDNESDIQISWAGAGYGKLICINHSQRAFKLAFPKQLELFATFLDLCSTSPQVATDRRQDYYCLIHTEI